jgi:GNAT superfamily N-acetyltransferase
MSTPKYDIVAIEEVDQEAVVGAIGSVFGPRSLAWYRWKHLENPAGTSLGWVAMDTDGVIGVRLLQRWDLLFDGETRGALRPVDTVTVPRARRRGVFQTLLDEALGHLADHREGDLLFNTPNENSRGGYAKNGWTLLPDIAHGLRVTFPGSRFGSPTDVGALDFTTQGGADAIVTAKTPAYLAWRYDPRSGHHYQAMRTPESEEPAAIVYRTATRKRSRTLILCEGFGPSHLIARLAAATARRERAVTTIALTGPGSRSAAKPHVTRGSTVLAVRPLAQIRPDPLALGSWALTLGDVEDVI